MGLDELWEELKKTLFQAAEKIIWIKITNSNQKKKQAGQNIKKKYLECTKKWSEESGEKGEKKR